MAAGNSSCIFAVLILISLVYDVFSDRISHTRTCADSECHTVISEAIALYQNKQEGSLPFEVNDRIKVLSKGVGSDSHIWGGLIKGHIGYFQKYLVKETTVFFEQPAFTVKPDDNTRNNNKEQDDNFLKEAQKTYEEMEMKNKDNVVKEEEKKPVDPTEFDETDENNDETDTSSDNKTKNEQKDVTDMEEEEKDSKAPTEAKSESGENEKKEEEGVDARNIDNKEEKNVDENKIEKKPETDNPETLEPIEGTSDETTTGEKSSIEEGGENLQNAEHSTKEEEIVQNSVPTDSEQEGKGAEADIKMSETKTDDKKDDANLGSSIQQTNDLNTDKTVAEKPDVVPADNQADNNDKSTLDLGTNAAQESLSSVQPTVTLQATNNLNEEQSVAPSVPDEKIQDNIVSITNSDVESPLTDSTQTTATEETQQSTMIDTPLKDDKPLEVEVPVKNNENNGNVPISNNSEESNTPQVEDQVHVNDGTTTMVFEGATTILPPDEDIESSIVPSMSSSFEQENTVTDRPNEATQAVQAANENQNSETERRTETPSARVERASQNMETDPSSKGTNVSDNSQTSHGKIANPNTEQIPDNTQQTTEQSSPKEESTTIETPPPEVTIETPESKKAIDKPVEPPVEALGVNNTTTDQPKVPDSNDKKEKSTDCDSALIHCFAFMDSPLRFQTQMIKKKKVPTATLR